MVLRRARVAAAALTVLLGVLAGCTEDPTDVNRPPGDPITTEEAEVLADVLHKNFEAGGADVTATAQYSEESTLTLTGEVDFTTGEGTMDAVTTYTTGQPEEDRTIYFTRDDLLIGNLPDFTEVAGDAGIPDALYLAVPLNPTGRLVDNVVALVQRLTAPRADNPDNLVGANYTWEASGRLNSTLISTYRSGAAGTTISVGATDQMMYQYTAPADSQNGVTITVTFTGHGERAIDLPPEEQVASSEAYPDIAAQFGF